VRWLIPDAACHRGQTLKIEANGFFHERVEKGAKVLLQVKYGLIRLINQEADFCDQITNVDLNCPLEKGDMTFTKEVDLPAQIPPVGLVQCALFNSHRRTFSSFFF
jgi:hypothetical protein